MPARYEVIGIEGLPEIAPRTDLAPLIAEAARIQGTPLTAGDLLVVSQKIDTNVPMSSYLAAGIGLFGATAGTLYQKRFGNGIPLIGGTAVQYLATTLVLIPLALGFETLKIVWSRELIFALIWLVVVLSLGAVCLLLYLIARTGIAQVTSLFYLVPPCTAVMAWAIFGEALTAPMMLGMALTAGGVALVAQEYQPFRCRLPEPFRQHLGCC